MSADMYLKICELIEESEDSHMDYEFIEDVLKEFMESNYKTKDSESYSGATRNAAKHWGISAPMVSYVMNHRSKPTEAMLDDIGYDEYTITFYTKRRK